MSVLCDSCYMTIEDEDGHVGSEGPICRGCFQAGCGQEEEAVLHTCPVCDQEFEFVEHQYDDDGLAICEGCFQNHYPEAAEAAAAEGAEAVLAAVVADAWLVLAEADEVLAEASPAVSSAPSSG